MIKRLYHFLGGISFAIFLITTVALFVIAGTLMESKTESHAYASKFTYENPLFGLIIWGFFINILFSATRRWPFRKKHIPFLITHLGLLMILSGVMIKNYFGTQGSMVILEGSGSDEIVLENTYVLQVEDENKKEQFELKDKKINSPKFNIQVLDYYPHSELNLETWIKDDKCFIYGLKPFFVNDASAISPTKTTASLQSEYPDFDVIAFKITNDKSVKELACDYYLKDLKTDVIDKKTGEKISNGNLSLNFDYTTFFGFLDPSLHVNIKGEEVFIPLHGKQALENEHPTYLLKVTRKPLLLLIQDKEENIFIFVYDKAGRVLSESFLKGQLNSYIAYNKGFHGYSVLLKFPLNLLNPDEIEGKRVLKLKNTLNLAESLIPPLQLLRNACEDKKLDFADVFVNYLKSDEAGLPTIDVNLIPERELKTCAWISVLVPPIMKKIDEGHNFLELLEIGGWPFIEDLKNSDHPRLFEAFIAQIYGVTDQLPSISIPNQNAIFSAYLKLYSIDLKNILPDAEDDIRVISLESPMTSRPEKATPHQKIEDNRPLISLKVNNEKVDLTYDPFGTSLKWPIDAGKYLMRFQSKFESIPYQIRLRNARQINYPGSTSSFSFEADLIITDKRNASISETTISMNNVHETWDGYRFYLSNISPGNELSVKHAQIVVNHDPAKYFLTYPGAIILSLGIFLLFWFKNK